MSGSKCHLICVIIPHRCTHIENQFAPYDIVKRLRGKTDYEELKKENKSSILKCKLSFRSHWNEDRLAAVYIEELAHGSSFLDLQNLFQEGVRLGEETCLFAGESSSVAKPITTKLTHLKQLHRIKNANYPG